jgi:hypothetical protein
MERVFGNEGVGSGIYCGNTVVVEDGAEGRAICKLRTSARESFEVVRRSVTSPQDLVGGVEDTFSTNVV